MKFKVKEAYLLILIVLGLVSLSVYSTYALFTKEVTIDNVVSFNATLSLSDSNLVEYELVTLNPNETKIIELRVSNSSVSTLYYGCWYETLSTNPDITIGMYLEKSNVPSTGTIATTEVKTLVVGIVNNSASTTLVNLGVVGSATENLGLSSSRIIITDTFSPAIIVTDEVLAANTTTTTENVNLEYTNPQKYEITLYPGTYLLETWGAQGESREDEYTDEETGRDYTTNGTGGKGGYSKGKIILTETTPIYIYVGGQAGFNGGGITNSSIGGNGGGASDIRIGTDSLYARVIVAGGGGGGYANYDEGHGGASGGSECIDFCGTQNSPGGILLDTSKNSNAGFGVGDNYYSCGAGGGWYGGRSGDGGGSGSNFVFTVDTENNTPVGYLLSEKYHLIGDTTTAGVRSSNGMVKITGTKTSSNYSIPVILGIENINITLGENISLTNGVTYACENGLNTCTYVGPSLTETSSLTEGTHIVNYTIKDSNGKNYVYKRIVSVVNGIIVTPTLLSQNTTISTSGNLSQETITYESTIPGTYFVKLNPGVYQLETWGAQGAIIKKMNSNSTSGGKGGYSVGSITISNQTAVYMNVGGQSNIYMDYDDGWYDRYDSPEKGYNGGGKSYFYNSSLNLNVREDIDVHGAGGGASDIRIGTNSLYARVIVAGGGSGSYINTTSGNTEGQSGGGTTGNGDNKGTQTSAGTYAAFGSGADKTKNRNGYGAGGGGWYGGGIASGGSGYVYTSSTASSYPTGCLLNSSYYLTNASTESGIWSGNGKVLITGHEYEKKYTIPRVLGIDDLKIIKGKSLSLTDGVTYACENSSTSCSYIGPDITNTSNLEIGTHSIKYRIKGSNNKTYIYERKVNVLSGENIDTSGANTPVLTDSLIPVLYDETTSTWVKADVQNTSSIYGWYDYDQKKWANAVLVSSTNRSTYQSASIGTTIADSDILAFYVWIPRYKYKVWNKDKIIGTQSYNAQTEGIDIVFESGTTSTGTISCTYSYAAPSSTAGSPNETCTGSNGDYYTHPAFTFGSQELTGFWIGKFELSSSSPTNSNGGGGGTSLTPRIIPNVASWRGNYLSSFWKVIYDMQKTSNIYGLPTIRTNVDSHMITNMEWGAVAYLTNSRFGRCTNGSCTEIKMNGYGEMNSNYSTKTGCGPILSGSKNYGAICNAYNTTLGQTASTTGNIYGVYDMSGGADEYVMGNMSSSNGTKYNYYAGRASDDFTYSTTTAKYLTPYTYGYVGNDQMAYNRSRLGDATGEIVLSGGSGWYSDKAYFIYSEYVWFSRGGAFSNGELCGLFNFDSQNGNGMDYLFETTRAILTIAP